MHVRVDREFDTYWRVSDIVVKFEGTYVNNNA